MKLLKTILAYFLSILVLVASTSFMVGIHICNGEVKGIAVFQKASACTHQAVRDIPACHKHLAKNCCSDTAVFHEGTGFNHSDYQTDITATQLVLACSAPYVLIAEIIPQHQTTPTFWNFDDPVRPQSRTILHHVFLI